MLAHSRLLNRHMLVGQVADTVAGLILNHVRSKGKVPSPERVEAVARDYAQKAVASSGRGASLVLSGKVPHFGSQVLSDHVWGTEPTMSDEQLAFRVSKAAVAFASSGVVQRLLSSAIDTWPAPRRREDPRPESWTVEGLGVSSAPDCWLEEAGRFVLLDWKASRTIGRDDGFQLAVYGLWAANARGVDPSEIYSQIVLMPLCPDYAPKAVGEEAIAIAHDTIRADWSAERSMVNVELKGDGVEIYVADRSAFPAQPDAAMCAACNFRMICPESQTVLVASQLLGSYKPALG